MNHFTKKSLSAKLKLAGDNILVKFVLAFYQIYMFVRFITHYWKPKTGKFDEGSCAICYVSPQIEKAFSPCGHTFCFACLVKWCIIKNECPTCKDQINIIHHGDGMKVYFPEGNSAIDLVGSTRPIQIVQGMNIEIIRKQIIGNEELRARFEMVLHMEQFKSSPQWFELRIKELDQEIEELQQIFEIEQRDSLQREKERQIYWEMKWQFLERRLKGCLQFISRTADRFCSEKSLQYILKFTC